MTIRIAGDEVAGGGLQGQDVKPAKEVIACAVSYNECQGEFEDSVGFCKNPDGSLRFMGTLTADVDNIRVTFSKGNGESEHFDLGGRLKGPWSADVTTSYGDDESLTINVVWFRGQAQAGRAWADITISTVDECQGAEGLGGCCCKEIIARLDHLIQLAEERNNLLHILVYGDGEPAPEAEELNDKDHDEDQDGTPDMYDPEPENPEVGGWDKQRTTDPETDEEGNTQSFNDWYQSQTAKYWVNVSIPALDWYFDPLGIVEANYRLQLEVPGSFTIGGQNYNTGVGATWAFDSNPNGSQEYYGGFAAYIHYWRPILRDLVSVVFTFWFVMFCYNQTKF